VQKPSPDIPPAFSLKDLLPVLAILAVAAVMYYPLFLGHPIMPDTWERFEPWNTELGYDGPTDIRISNANNDAILLYIPWNRFAHDELNAGRIPAWDPSCLCGVPLVANHLVPVFYPVYAFIAWLATPLMILGISGLIHTVIMGLFFYLFLKEWLGNRIAAWAAASFLVVSLIPNPFYQPWPMTLAWFPAIWFFYERWLRHRNPWAGLWMALCWACPLLSGYPSLFIQLSLFTGVWFLIRPVAMPVENRPSVISRVLILALPFVLAVGISMVQNIPTMLASGESDRTFLKSSEELAREASFTIPPNQPWQTQLKKLLLPAIPITFPGNDFFNRGHIGAIPVFLALIGLVCVRRRNFPRYVLLLALIVAPFALVPAFNFMAYQSTGGVLIDPNPPIEILGFLILMMSAITLSFFFDDNLEPEFSRRLMVSMIGFSIFFVVSGGYFLLREANAGLSKLSFYYVMSGVILLFFLFNRFVKNSPGNKLRHPFFSHAYLVLIIIYMAATNPTYYKLYDGCANVALLEGSTTVESISDLIDPDHGGQWGRVIRHSGGPVNVMSLTDQPYTFYPNLGTYFGIPDAFGYHNLAPKSRFDFLRELQNDAVIEHRGIVAFTEPIESIINSENFDLLAARYVLSDVEINSLDPVYSQDNFYVYDTNVESISRFKIAGEGYHLPPNESPDWASEPVIITDDPGHAIAEVSTDRNAVLYFYEGYATGWTASMDGNPSDIGTIDGMVMFVDVPPGDHTIEFRYVMPGLKAGWSVTLSSLLIWIIFGIGFSITTRNRRLQNQSR